MVAGGFTRDNQQMVFYPRVRALLPEGARVLEFGAGRGMFAELFRSDGRQLPGGHDRPAHGRRPRVGLRRRRRVLGNPMLDDAAVITPGEPLPYADDSFDLIVSWAVFEHVANPEFTASELARVLKPGGWLCAWTPQKWGMVGVGARLVPNRYHAKILSQVLKKDDRGEEDVFPTTYLMNTRRRLKELFPPERFVHATYPFSGRVGYIDRWWAGRALAKTYRLVPGGGTASFLHIFIQKK